MRTYRHYHPPTPGEMMADGVRFIGCDRQGNLVEESAEGREIFLSAKTIESAAHRRRMAVLAREREFLKRYLT